MHCSAWTHGARAAGCRRRAWRDEALGAVAGARCVCGSSRRCPASSSHTPRGVVRSVPCLALGFRSLSLSLSAELQRAPAPLHGNDSIVARHMAHALPPPPGAEGMGQTRGAKHTQQQRRSSRGDPAGGGRWRKPGPAGGCGVNRNLAPILANQPASQPGRLRIRACRVSTAASGVCEHCELAWHSPGARRRVPFEAGACVPGAENGRDVLPPLPRD